MSGPFVKVCGVTREEDLDLAIELGADFVGLNFHPSSPRYLAPERAAVLAARARGRVAVVGVFVDRRRAEVEEIAEAVGLDLLQFHGAEGPDDLAPFGDRAVKVLRLAPGERPAPEGLAATLASYPAAWGFLVDARHPTLAGGTGESWSWGAIAGTDSGGRPLLVAGGIRPDNAAEALAASGAAGIDVCSGVEAAPGVKDRDLLAGLFRAVGAVRAGLAGRTESDAGTLRSYAAGSARPATAGAAPAPGADVRPRPEAGYDGAHAGDARSPNPRTPARGATAPTDPPEDPDGEDRAP